jgi:S-adenosylmethionine:tRNA ribosyltransferase-isomerase
MRKNDLTTLYGDTEIFIFPSYKFQVVDGLITNFHQPESTLILLIASFLGDDWKKVYQEALNNEYRFLSYGDSSLLIP